MDGHRFIENQNIEEKEALRKKTEEKLGFSFSREASKENKSHRVSKLCTAFATAFCAVCLIIALPLIMNKSAVPSGSGMLNDSGRYGGANDYYRQAAECNIKEYNYKHGTNMLYIDFYDIAEDVFTYVYFSGTDKSTLLFCETIYSQENFNEIDLYILDEKTVFESLRWHEEIAESQNRMDAMGIQVNWFGTENAGTIVFRYKGYKYVVELCNSVNSEDILGIVTYMLKSDKTVQSA